MTKNDGGPAFPVPLPDGEPIKIGGLGSSDFPSTYKAKIDWTGMSLRDWFAGMALQGMLAKSGAGISDERDLSDARLAYTKADAMLAQREK